MISLGSKTFMAAQPLSSLRIIPAFPLLHLCNYVREHRKDYERDTSAFSLASLRLLKHIQKSAAGGGYVQLRGGYVPTAPKHLARSLSRGPGGHHKFSFPVDYAALWGLG